MADPFLSQIILFGGTYAPRMYALCDGQLLAINQNEALFSLLGTMFGGDGRTTFGLPDARGRVVFNSGRGPGLPSYQVGQRGGSEEELLTQTQMPAHNHAATATLSVSSVANPDPGTTSSPANNVLAEADISIRGGGQATGNIYAAATTANTTMAPPAVTQSVSLENSGGSQPHTNMQPFGVVNYVIALQGTYPSRN